MSGVVFWFRRDLRLDDNPALLCAVALAQARNTWLMPVVLADEQVISAQGQPLARSARQIAWLDGAKHALKQRLRALGSDLWVAQGLGDLRQLLIDSGAQDLVAESIVAPDELAQQQALMRDWAGQAHWLWQSTLFDPADLPFAPAEVPKVFTAFRHAVGRTQRRATAPVAAPQALPPWPAHLGASDWVPRQAPPHDARSSVQATRASGEAAALAHWQGFLARGLAHRYLDTRNALSGADFSSQLSLDLATGAISVRRASAMLSAFEATHGASKSSYWLWFEWMWRDHFRWLHWRYGAALYRARGLAEAPRAVHASHSDWQAWCAGETGQPLVDAGMRELAATGYVSNRMRQIVASFWIHDMGGDWRDGAAWFQSQLLDEDVYSNQGNWLYIAGLGSDPRGGRRFDVRKQTAQHDAQGRYQALWSRA